MADKETVYKVQFKNVMCWQTAKAFKSRSSAVKLADKMARNGDVTRVVKVEATVVYFK